MTLPAPATDSIAGNIQVAHQAIEDAKERLQRKSGVPPEWRAVLLNIRMSPGTSLSKLARLLRLPQKSAEKLLAEIESAGLIERRWHPVREQIYELHVSERGRAGLASTDNLEDELENELAAKLGKDDVERFLTIVRQIAVVMSELAASEASEITD